MLKLLLMNNKYLKHLPSQRGLSFVEIMLAFGILASVFLPIFKFLTGTVKDTEKLYTEIVAISRAKFIMDTLMFQMPWRAIRADNPCVFDDPNDGVGNVDELIEKAVPKMFGEGCRDTSTPTKNVYVGKGLYTDRKGFIYAARAKVVDLYKNGANSIRFSVDGKPEEDPEPDSDGFPGYPIKKLVSKDADGNFNVIKKIIVQVKWSNIKGRDPKKDPRAKTIFLVGFKSRLWGR